MCYLTAPKVRPRTNCRCAAHPNTRMGAMARTEAADSFARKRPCGLEKVAMKTARVPALALVRLMLQNASFQQRMSDRRADEASPGRDMGSKRCQISCQT